MLKMPTVLWVAAAAIVIATAVGGTVAFEVTHKVTVLKAILQLGFMLLYFPMFAAQLRRGFDYPRGERPPYSKDQIFRMLFALTAILVCATALDAAVYAEVKDRFVQFFAAAVVIVPAVAIASLPSVDLFRLKASCETPSRRWFVVSTYFMNAYLSTAILGNSLLSASSRSRDFGGVVDFAIGGIESLTLLSTSLVVAVVVRSLYAPLASGRAPLENG